MICDRQGSAADVVMCAMLEIESNARLKELGWRLLLQVCLLFFLIIQLAGWYMARTLKILE